MSDGINDRGISVIIPVFNTGDRLEECLQSVASQTYPGFECILVDDGSTDGSGAICDQFALQDNRFKVIHQENRGVSAARNKGLEVASGEYVAFVDSDDLVAPRYLEAMLGKMKESGADLVICGMTVHDTEGKSFDSQPRGQACFFFDHADTEQFLELEKANLLFCPFVKLYKKKSIDQSGIRFDVNRSYGEDFEFNLGYLEKVSSIAVVQEPLYIYQRGVDTLSTKLRPDQFANDYGQWRTLRTFHVSKGLMGASALEFLYQRLWGIVYDGIFLFPRLEHASLGYLKRILAIPEIDDLKEYAVSFTCAPWIKRWILNRRAGLFCLYFKLFRKK